MKKMRFATLSMLALLGCASEEVGTSSESEVVTDVSSFSIVDYRFTMEVRGLTTPPGISPSDCFATLFLANVASTGSIRVTQPFTGASDTTVGGWLQNFDGRRELHGDVTVGCRRATPTEEPTEANVEVVFDGFSAPVIGNTSTVTAKVGKLEANAPNMLANAVIALSLEATAIRPAPPPSATNCDAFEDVPRAEVERYAVRVLTDVTVGLPNNSPYGDDWEAELVIDDGAMRMTYYPKLNRPSILLLEYCKKVSDGPAVALKVDVRENDVLRDDTYKNFEATLTRGQTEERYVDHTGNEYADQGMFGRGPRPIWIGAEVH
jgi:hypothetical protein